MTQWWLTSKTWHMIRCMRSRRGHSSRERRERTGRNLTCTAPLSGRFPMEENVAPGSEEEEDHDPQEVFSSGPLYCYFRRTLSDCPCLHHLLRLCVSILEDTWQEGNHTDSPQACSEAPAHDSDWISLFIHETSKHRDALHIGPQ